MFQTTHNIFTNKLWCLVNGHHSNNSRTRRRLLKVKEIHSETNTQTNDKRNAYGWKRRPGLWSHLSLCTHAELELSTGRTKWGSECFIIKLVEAQKLLLAKNNWHNSECNTASKYRDKCNLSLQWMLLSWTQASIMASGVGKDDWQWDHNQ